MTPKQMMTHARKLNTKLAELNDSFSDDAEAYYKTQDLLKRWLLDIEAEDFTKLDKSDLLDFLSWCSAHRPVQPHSLLTRISILNERGET